MAVPTRMQIAEFCLKVTRYQKTVWRALSLKQDAREPIPTKSLAALALSRGTPRQTLARKTRHAKHRNKAPTNQLLCSPLFDVGGRRGLAEPLRRTCLNRPTRFEHHSGMPSVSWMFVAGPLFLRCLRRYTRPRPSSQNRRFFPSSPVRTATSLSSISLMK